MRCYESYLTYIYDTCMDSPTLNSVNVVFPTDLPSIPIIHEIEFAIDHDHGNEPIYVAPYHMDPTKLKELNSWLKDFFCRGFIRLGMSPLGARILFVKK